MITIVSTRVTDVLQDEAGRIIETRPGGPAYYIERVFQKADIPYQLVTGQEMTVKIVSVPGKDQVGKVQDYGLRQKIPKVDTPHLLVSTLYEEWDLDPLSGYGGNLFLDVQGFVRNPQVGYGRKKKWAPPFGLVPLFVKTNFAELAYIPAEFAEDQRRRGLIVTHDRFGSEIYWQGRREIIPTGELVETNDTLGAGDTYFARFTIEFLNTGDPIRAARQAAVQARQLLEERNK